MTSRHAAGDDSYQVDVIVALFAILIVLLVSLAAGTASDNSDAVTNYRPTDAETAPTTLRALQVPYRLRELWLVDADGLMRRIDSVALARAVREGSTGFDFQSIENGIDAQIDLMESELGSYRVSIDVLDPEAAGWLIDRTVDPTDSEALVAWAAEPSSALLFVDFDAHRSLGLISTALDDGLRNGLLVQLRNGNRYAIRERSSARMSAQDVFRE